ncbi:virulence RhuM family protein [Desulfosudis oleivorans]|uniref:Putative DNA-binding protein n=1 Tax=Desulfosudis oleivorans (strain DSM 6200 / JCM 39069 / Hxd3) TaxID=96561 RepID=A8ZUT4_DESOH|nr:virulence RhuM family protein [Desulfosudis oleivorans]ABW66497.1 putative DNA-binding protein [Desulfosudis oleivorans Hxd3]
MTQSSGTSEIVFYQTEDGKIKIDTVFQDETIWLTQAKMAELFAVNVPAISKHLNNIFEEGELQKEATVSKMETVQQEGSRQVTRTRDFYNLDAIIAVGYRVNSKRATQFRIWATHILKEYIIKGFAMNDDRLKQADRWDYFDEWLERIRDIRASEKRFYQKIRDIYATSIDYDKHSEQAQIFFKKVQNKMLWAITGKTAAEIIESRSNPDKPNMGLTSWRGSTVRKFDVGIAKNYLKADEIKDLNEIVTMYLDYAERQARQRKTVTMEQWSGKLDAFLKFNEQELLTHAGAVKAEVARKIAEDRYEAFDKKRKTAEARAADKEDLKELEEIEKRLLEKRHKK